MGSDARSMGSASEPRLCPNGARPLSRASAADIYDPVEAGLWLERAVAQGVEEAQEDLDALPTEEIVPSRNPGATINSEPRRIRKLCFVFGA